DGAIPLKARIQTQSYVTTTAVDSGSLLSSGFAANYTASSSVGLFWPVITISSRKPGGFSYGRTLNNSLSGTKTKNKSLDKL
ncbi:hypothetical protein J6590_034885, partial [Homalodisca vitripennis]